MDARSKKRSRRGELFHVLPGGEGAGYRVLAEEGGQGFSIPGDGAVAVKHLFPEESGLRLSDRGHHDLGRLLGH